MTPLNLRAWRALVWKEARGMTAVSVTLGTFFLVILVLGGHQDSPALRTDWPKLAWILAVVIGGVHGLVISLPERLGGTREYLLHRSVSREKIFAAKVLTGTGFAILAWALPLALISLLSDSDSAALSLPQVWLACGALGTNLISALGWGVFVGYLIHERSRALTIWALGILGFLALGLLQLWPSGSGPLARSAYFAATHCAIGALCILSASQAFKHPADPDLLPSTKSMGLWLPSLAIVLALPMGIFLPGLQSLLRKSVMSDYPVLAVSDEGELALLDRNPGGGWSKLDPQGRAPKPLAQEELARRASDPGKWKQLFRPSLGTPLAKTGTVQVAPKLRLLTQLFYTNVRDVRELGSSDLWLDEESGELVICHRRGRVVGNPVFVPWPERMPDSHSLRLKKPAGAPFSTQTICAVPDSLELLQLPIFGGPIENADRLEVHPLWILDPEDGASFICQPWDIDNVLVRAPLPAGDRMRAVARGLHPLAATYGMESRGPWLVQGSFGNYKLGSDGVQRVESSEWIFPGDTTPAFVVSVDSSDLLRPSVEVSDQAGELLFSGSFGPNSLLSYGAFGVNQLAVLLWPPPLALRSYMLSGAGRSARSRPLICEELVGSGRLELLIGAVLCSALLALRTRKELRARGQSKARCSIWMCLHALCGPIAFVIYRLLEPKLTGGELASTANQPKWILSKSEATL